MDRADGALRITLARSDRADDVQLLALTLPPGATLADALRAAGWSAPDGAVGVWGRLQPATHRLRDGDRVELYRPLLVDPKEARRQRYKRQRSARRS